MIPVSDWQVIILRPAKRYLKRLSRVDKERILDALEQLRASPSKASVKPLTGRAEWRLRIGDFRALFRVDEENKLFIITIIGPRGDIYKQ